MRYLTCVFSISTILWLGCDLACQRDGFLTQHKGKYFEINLDFKAPEFARQAAEVTDRAWVAINELYGKLPGRSDGPLRIDVRLDKEAHDAVVGEIIQSSGFSNSNLVPRTYSTSSHCYLLVRESDLKLTEFDEVGFYGAVAQRIISNAVSFVDGWIQLPFLREGIQGYIGARMLGADSRMARAKHPTLAGSQVRVRSQALHGRLPATADILLQKGSFDGSTKACIRELFFMLLEQHETKFRQLLKTVNRSFYPDTKEIHKLIRQVLGKDLNFNTEFQSYCEAARPEWQVSAGMWDLPGSSDRLFLSGHIGGRGVRLPAVHRAYPMDSSDYDISGRIGILDRQQRVGVLVFNQKFEDRGRRGWRSPKPAVSIRFGADGRVSVGVGDSSFTQPGATGQAASREVGVTRKFLVSVRGRQIEVQLDGKSVLTWKSPVGLKETWGLVAPAGSAAIWENLGCFNRGMIFRWIDDLAVDASAATARSSLLDMEAAAVPFLTDRLLAIASNKAAKPDGILQVLRELGPVAGSAVAKVVSYLEKCDPTHTPAVLDALAELLPHAPNAVRKRIATSSLLSGPAPAGMARADWVARSLGVRKRASVEIDAPIQTLIALVKANAVFTREAAADALGLRGAAALKAVPVLLKNMKTPKALAKDARAIKVDGLEITLRDSFFHHCQEALVAIAPEDPRIYRVYSDRLRDKSDPAERVAAAKALGQLGEFAARAVPLMLKLVTKDTDEPVLIATIEALARIGRPAKKGLYRLRRLLKAKTTEAVKAAAAATIQKLQ